MHQHLYSPDGQSRASTPVQPWWAVACINTCTALVGSCMHQHLYSPGGQSHASTPVQPCWAVTCINTCTALVGSRMHQHLYSPGGQSHASTPVQPWWAVACINTCTALVWWAVACINTCAHVHMLKTQTLANITPFEYTDILHTLVGMGSWQPYHPLKTQAYCSHW